MFRDTGHKLPDSATGHPQLSQPPGSQSQISAVTESQALITLGESAARARCYSCVVFEDGRQQPSLLKLPAEVRAACALKNFFPMQKKAT